MKKQKSAWYDEMTSIWVSRQTVQNLKIIIIDSAGKIKTMDDAIESLLKNQKKEA